LPKPSTLTGASGRWSGIALSIYQGFRNEPSATHHHRENRQRQWL
jgi:hypothetical protein